MTISALKEIEMQFCQILRPCAVLMTKADKKVVFFHNMISVRFLPYWKNDVFYQFCCTWRAFTVIARVDKRLQFRKLVKAVQCTVRKLQAYPGLSTGLVNLRRMTWR